MTRSVDLVAFLRARIDEDETAAQSASLAPWEFPGIDSVAGGNLYDATRVIASVDYEQPDDHDGSIVRHLLSDEADRNGAHIVRWDPTRAMAECRVKRDILDRYVTMVRLGSPRGTDYLWSTLWTVATVYADHPDFDRLSPDLKDE